MKTFLSVLLIILKVLGITLASILGLVVLILLLVLFVPIRYKGAGYYRDGEYDFSAKVSYLLHIVTLSFDLKNEKKPVIKIFGIELKKKEKKQKIKKQKKSRKKVKKENLPKAIETGNDELTLQNDNSSVEVSLSETSQPYESAPQDIAESAVENSEKSEASEIPVSDLNTDSGEDNITPQSSDTKSQKKAEKKKKEKKKKEKKKKSSTGESFYDKIKGIKEKIQSEEFKESFHLIKEKLFVLLKAVLPKKWRVEGKVGFDDPSMNGKVCGLLGMFYPLIHNHVFVTCDFEETGIDVSAKFKGRIFIITLVVVAIKVYFNKSIRKTFGF